MSSLDNLTNYGVRVSEPYLSKNIAGNYVIIQDEVLYSENPTMQGHELIFMSEILVDDNPSEKEIFKYKLKGDVKAKKFLIGHRLTDN